jgi:hypothetical protein
MYYLVVNNLGVQRCIHREEEDVYAESRSFSCTPDLEFPGGFLVRKIGIRCLEHPGKKVEARVYSDDRP